MTVPLARLYNGDGRVLNNRMYQTLSASRNKQINVFVKAHHFVHNFVTCIFDKLYAILGNAIIRKNSAHQINKEFVCVKRIRTAAKYNRVARFETQWRGVNSNVGTAFKNYSDNTHWNAYFPYIQTVRQLVLAQYFSCGVG